MSKEAEEFKIKYLENKTPGNWSVNEMMQAYADHVAGPLRMVLPDGWLVTDDNLVLYSDEKPRPLFNLRKWAVSGNWWIVKFATLPGDWTQLYRVKDGIISEVKEDG